MSDRNELGYFQPGHSVKSPGRPPRSTEAGYLQRMTELLTPEKWDKIVNKAITDAMKGSSFARQWLTDYVIGKPVTTIQLVASEQALLNEVLMRLSANGGSASELFQAMLNEIARAEVENEQQ